MILIPPIDLSHVIYEDDPAWDCTSDGNRVCGPGNANGVPAGQYDESGVLTIPWDQLKGMGR